MWKWRKSMIRGMLLSHRDWEIEVMGSSACYAEAKVTGLSDCVSLVRSNRSFSILLLPLRNNLCKLSIGRLKM